MVPNPCSFHSSSLAELHINMHLVRRGQTLKNCIKLQLTVNYKWRQKDSVNTAVYYYIVTWPHVPHVNALASYDEKGRASFCLRCAYACGCEWPQSNWTEPVCMQYLIKATNVVYNSRQIFIWKRVIKLFQQWPLLINCLSLVPVSLWDIDLMNLAASMWNMSKYYLLRKLCDVHQWD